MRGWSCYSTCQKSNFWLSKLRHPSRNRRRNGQNIDTFLQVKLIRCPIDIAFHKQLLKKTYALGWRICTFQSVCYRHLKPKHFFLTVSFKNPIKAIWVPFICHSDTYKFPKQHWSVYNFGVRYYHHLLCNTQKADNVLRVHILLIRVQTKNVYLHNNFTHFLQSGWNTFTSSLVSDIFLLHERSLGRISIRKNQFPAIWSWQLGKSYFSHLFLASIQIRSNFKD